MTQTLDTRPEISVESSAASAPDILEEDAQAGLSSPVIARINEGLLHYAGTPSAAAQEAAPSLLKNRGYQVDWFQWGVIALMLTSAATCLSRLLWAIQP